jgi:predicted GIY-YIG superfamily endonuclease
MSRTELTDNVSWSPKVDTGLSGQRLLPDALAPHVDDPDAGTDRPGVYVLELSTPPAKAGHETHARLWLEQNEVTPSYLPEVVAAGRLLYVGYAASVRNRIHTHLNSPNQSSALTRVYPIHDIDTVWWYETAEIAQTREHGHRIELNNELSNAYVHSR